MTVLGQRTVDVPTNDDAEDTIDNLKDWLDELTAENETTDTLKVETIVRSSHGDKTELGKKTFSLPTGDSSDPTEDSHYMINQHGSWILMIVMDNRGFKGIEVEITVQPSE